MLKNTKKRAFFTLLLFQDVKTAVLEEIEDGACIIHLLKYTKVTLAQRFLFFVVVVFFPLLFCNDCSAYSYCLSICIDLWIVFACKLRCGLNHFTINMKKNYISSTF